MGWGVRLRLVLASIALPVLRGAASICSVLVGRNTGVGGCVGARGEGGGVADAAAHTLVQPLLQTALREGLVIRV